MGALDRRDRCNRHRLFSIGSLGPCSATKPEGVAVFWPPAGVATNALIALGPGSRWLAAIGTTAATVAANLLGDRTLSNAAVSALSNAGRGAAHSMARRDSLRTHFALNSLRQVLTLMAATAVGTAISGISGAAGFMYFQGSATSGPSSAGVDRKPGAWTAMLDVPRFGADAVAHGAARVAAVSEPHRDNLMARKLQPPEPSSWARRRFSRGPCPRQWQQGSPRMPQADGVVERHNGPFVRP
jgi:hypothetical protein